MAPVKGGGQLPAKVGGEGDRKRLKLILASVHVHDSRHFPTSTSLYPYYRQLITSLTNPDAGVIYRKWEVP
jgi:hypothetical protein